MTFDSSSGGISPIDLDESSAGGASQTVGKFVCCDSSLSDTPAMLAERQSQQLAQQGEIDAFCDFQFVDRQPESGITFLHRVVGDAAKTYEAVHYDHGNGIAVADVDGDGLLDIYFVTQAGRNELWHNLGDGTFEDWTERAGVSVDDRISVAASFADIDNDGDADLYVTSVREGNVLLENDGSGVFTDITQDSGLGHQGHCSGAVFFDYDRDGLLDVFLTNVGQYTSEEQVPIEPDVERTIRRGQYFFYDGLPDAFAGHLKPERTERSLLFRNVDGKTFQDVTAEVGLEANGWSGDATAFDVNGDGWIDLYVLNMQGHDQYFENQEGRAFVDRSSEVFPNTPWGAMGVELLDLENDGDLDLYITDMHSDMFEDVDPEREKEKSDESVHEFAAPALLVDVEGNVYGNAFYRNNGDGTFTEISDEIGAENYWPWGLSTGDLNADGYQDAFVASSMNYPYRYGINSLLLNERGEKLVDSEFILGVEPRRDGRYLTPWFMIDFDREEEFAGTRRQTLEGLAETVHGRHIIWAALGSRSSVLFDLDDDGDLDIVTNDFNSAPMVLVSDLSEKKPDLHYLTIELVGSESNRSGLGALVEVEAGGQTLTQLNDGKSGYLSQSLMPLYFGLGDAATAESITVRWPSGRLQQVEGPIDANQKLVIEEQAE